jgi:D-aminoacyl-tRNA deacylase
VVQRVRRAEVQVAGETVASMAGGLLVLVGVARGDRDEDAAALAAKLVHLRVFPDGQGRMNHSLLDTGGTLGLVSQFTLLGDARQGRRPSYAEAAAPAEAEALLATLADACRRAGVTVVTGVFGAYMEVGLVNDGPVTLLLDTARRF